jgi:hypothetical protein
MKKKTMILLIILANMGLLPGEKVADLPRLLKPNGMVLDASQLFVTDKGVIHMYRIKPFKHEKTFGKIGEGPGEYKFPPRLHLLDTSLFGEIYFNKIIFFSRDGRFLREKRLSSRISAIRPIGNHFVGMVSRYSADRKNRFREINMYDSDLTLQKTLSQRTQSAVQSSGGKIVLQGVKYTYRYRLNQQRIVIGDSRKGYYFEVFDARGNRVNTINREYKSGPVTDEYKKHFMRIMEKTPGWQRIRSRVEFKWLDRFPAYQTFSLGDDHIYVYHYFPSESQEKVTVLDLQGKVVKEVILPRVETTCIYNGRYYYLQENEDTENWELHMIKILP